MNRPTTLSVWQSQQRNRQDPVGDFARDMAQDIAWPVIAGKRDTYERSLIRRGASDNAIAALHRAWAEYETERSNAA